MKKFRKTISFNFFNTISFPKEENLNVSKAKHPFAAFTRNKKKC